MAVDIIAAFTYQDGVAFPNSGSKDVSAPGAQDGTEFFTTMIDNYMFGPQQMMLNHAGLTPDGVIESDSASQMKEALWKGFGGHPGMVNQWHLDDDPSVTGHRCLFLNGQGILRANFTDLDDAVYVGDGNNAAVAAAGGAYFRADNSDGTSPSTTGIYLILPETRGYVPRGLDAAATVDPDGASRFLGDLQTDAVQLHQHGMVLDTSAESGGLTAAFWSARDTTAVAAVQNDTSTYEADGGGTPRTDSETRMTNYSTKFVVWY